MFRRKWTNVKAARRQAEIYERLWHNFTLYPTAEDGRHDTPAWNEKPGDFCACIIRIPIESLMPDIEVLRQDLSRLEGVRIHPPSFLHLMLQELGLVVEASESRYEVTPERMEEFGSAVETELSGAPTFWLNLGGVNAFRDSVVLEAKDKGQTARIHRRLNELAAIPVRSSYAFLPHVTIAHLTRDAPMPSLRSVLEPWRRTTFGTIRVDEIEIVTIDVMEEYPDLVHRTRIPLNG